MKYIDENGLLYLIQKIKTLLNGKVDKVEGKGLSTNDLTDELKQKIIDAGSSSFSGAYSDLTGKPKINNVELGANNTLADLGIQAAGDYATNEELTNKLKTKVDAVSGKGLSTNDYTSAEKEKLSNIAENAQVNVIETIKVNGTTKTVTDKAVNINVPTALSELNNDKNFVSDSNYVHTDNNFTTSLKNKLNGIADGAQVNVIETVKVNGKAITPTEKVVDITTPTKVSDLNNDSKFQTESEVTSKINSAISDKVTTAQMNSAISTATNDMATQTWVNSQLANINKKEVVTSISQMTDSNTIYLIANAGESNNIYDEYIVINGTPEKIGTTEVDLTNYVKTSDLIAITNPEIEEIFSSAI